jgi:hypothetical protein
VSLATARLAAWTGRGVGPARRWSEACRLGAGWRGAGWYEGL